MSSEVISRLISELKPHPRNYNNHSDRQVDDLALSLKRFGQRKPIVTWRDMIVAGHGLTMAAQMAGWTSILTMPIPDDWDEATVLAYLAADNELARQADPDLAQLAAITKELEGIDEELAKLAAGGDDALKALMATIEDEKPNGDAEPQIDKAEELRQKWDVQSGQMWQLGEHRIICGDCTDRAVVERVMGGEKADCVVTDSPYGINREGIENDDPKGLRLLFDKCLAVMPTHDAVIINFQSPRLFPVWLDAIRYAGHKFERLLWMYDENDQTKPWHYWLMCSQAICISSVGKPMWAECKAHHDTYTIGLSREWRSGGAGNDFSHASVKPVGLIQDLMSHTVGVVYEPFSGSGTTLIACENLSRKCRAVEISPAYVAVAIQRWVDVTGKEPILL
jgi:DNA modification methylase